MGIEILEESERKQSSYVCTPEIGTESGNQEHRRFQI